MRWVLPVLLFLVGNLVIGIGCDDGGGDGDASADADADSDVDSDSDVDTDVDGDADSDSDVDADSDADADHDADPEVDADEDADEDGDVPTSPRTVLVSQGGHVVILDLDGGEIEDLTIPAEHLGDYETRGIVEDGAGRIHVYAGTFEPRLATYDGGSWSSQTVEGWDTANVTYVGHLASRGDVVLATDFLGAVTGLARFDFAAGTAEVVGTRGYTDVVFGLDGLLYVLDYYDTVYTLDPATLAVTSTLDWSTVPDVFVVDASGDLHGAWWNGDSLWTYPRAGGEPTEGPSLGTTDICDVDLAPDGTVVVCGTSTVVITDLDGSSMVTATVPGLYLFCAFGYVSR